MPLPDDSDDICFAQFAERPIFEVQRAFDTLLARGMIATEPAGSGETAFGGPVLRELCRRFSAVEFVELGVKFRLHEPEKVDDSLGGWRIRCEPDELDIRVADDGSSDVVFDATWSPRGGGEVIRHSTILHFMVRALVGDRLSNGTTD